VPGIDAHGIGAVLPIRPVPVVASINWLRRETRGWTHLATECVKSGKRRLTLLTTATRNVADVESAFAELHTGGTTPNIRAQTDAVFVDLPEAERVGARMNSVCIRALSVVRREIPRHDAIGDPSTPLEISVCSLPRVAQNEMCGGHLTAPAKIQSLHGNRRR